MALFSSLDWKLVFFYSDPGYAVVSKIATSLGAIFVFQSWFLTFLPIGVFIDPGALKIDLTPYDFNSELIWEQNIYNKSQINRRHPN